MLSCGLSNYSWLWDCVYSASITHKQQRERTIRSNTELLYVLCSDVHRTTSAPHNFQSAHPLPYNSRLLISPFYCTTLWYTNTRAAVLSDASELSVDSTLISGKTSFSGRCMYVFPLNRGQTRHIQEREVPFKCRKQVLDWRWIQSKCSHILRKDKNSMSIMNTANISVYYVALCFLQVVGFFYVHSRHEPLQLLHACLKKCIIIWFISFLGDYYPLAVLASFPFCLWNTVLLLFKDFLTLLKET